jgi:hypothetical protein
MTGFAIYRSLRDRRVLVTAQNFVVDAGWT